MGTCECKQVTQFNIVFAIVIIDLRHGRISAIVVTNSNTSTYVDYSDYYQYFKYSNCYAYCDYHNSRAVKPPWEYH